jgi:hypothetical protein
MLGGPACSTLSDFFGSGGLGGNLQFTIGTNTTVNWGRQYQINMGGETITYDANQQTAASKALCAIIGATCIVFSIAYGACSDEDDRATLVIIFQITIDVLLGAFMAYQAALKGGTQTFGDMIRGLRGSGAVGHTTTWENGGIMAAAAITGVLGAIVTPLVAVAVEEGHFASQQSQTRSAS